MPSCERIFSQVSAAAVTFTPNFTVSSEAAVLINLDKDVIVYEKNPTKKMYPASLTKIMTAIVVFLRIGVAKVADTALLNSSFSEIMVGIVILMLVGCEFFIKYSIKFKHSKKEAQV